MAKLYPCFLLSLLLLGSIILKLKKSDRFARITFHTKHVSKLRSVSLILPCYNPPEGWADSVVRQYRLLQQLIPAPIELILVLDGDDHHTGKAGVEHIAASIPNFRLIKYPANKGKGFAIRQGVLAASGAMIIYTDIDFPYSNESVHAIYTAINNEGFDVAIGVKNEDYYKLVPPIRRSISRGLRLLIRAFLNMPITDTQCGLKGFRSEVKNVFLQTTINRYLFDLEFVRNCYRYKPPIKLKAVPVQLKEGVQFRNMNYRILLPEMLNFIKLLFKKTV